MFLVEDYKFLFPKAREVLLPFAGAAYAWVFAMKIFGFELSDLEILVVKVCVTCGTSTVLLECFFMTRGSVLQHLVLYIVTAMEPVAYLLLAVLFCSFIDVFRLEIHAQNLLVQFGVAGITNSIFIALHVVCGLIIGTWYRNP